MPKPAKRQPIPSFSSEDRSETFWAAKDTSKYIDWSEAENVALPNLRPSTRTISIRLPEPMIDRLKVLATSATSRISHS